MSVAGDLIEQFSDVHPLPHVVTTVTRLIADNESTMKDFEDVIKMDPILVSRLLRLVNSPYYGVTQTINSIGRAVAFLGIDRKSTRLNSSHRLTSRMPSSA
jgi:HD-like signal output (HDOD) protein